MGTVIAMAPLRSGPRKPKLRRSECGTVLFFTGVRRERWSRADAEKTDKAGNGSSRSGPDVGL